MIKFWLGIQVQAHGRVIFEHTQEKPFLLLPYAHRFLPLADESPGQLVTQPATGHAQHLYRVLGQSHLLFQLPVQGIFSGLAAIDPALGKLPGIAAAHPTCPQYLTVVVGQHDSYVWSKTILVDHVTSYFLALEPFIVPHFQAPEKFTLHYPDAMLALFHPVTPPWPWQSSTWTIP